MIKPVNINTCIRKEESIIILLSSIILWFFASIDLLDKYHWIGGGLLLLFFIGSLYLLIQCAKRQKQSFEMIGFERTRRNLLFIIFGIVAVISGAWLLIESTVSIAAALGIPSFLSPLLLLLRVHLLLNSWLP